jgi:hypothetical protein
VLRASICKSDSLKTMVRRIKNDPVATVTP